MKPKLNDSGVYCEDQWEDDILIGEEGNKHRKPNCHIHVVKVAEGKWIGSTNCQSNHGRCGYQGGGSYPGKGDEVFKTKGDCIAHHAEYLHGRFVGFQKETGDIAFFKKIIDKLADLARVKENRQLTIFEL